MKSKRLQALVMATAVLSGYGGAAAYSALAAPALPVITDWGPGDGLTRYVLTAASGAASPSLLGALEEVDGVVSAQSLSDGRALVATDGLPPRDLRAVAGVSAVEVSPTVPVAATVSDPLFPGYGWHLDNTGGNAYGQSPVVVDADTDAADTWDVGTGDGLVVAVVDSGFDSDHPDLAGSLWTNPAESCGSVDTDGNGKAGDCHGWNWYSNSADVDNGSYGSHGASVSGTVGARANNGTGLAGVAPDVTIMPLVIGGGSTVDVLAGAEAIRYAVDHGADVINASWGGAVTGYALDALRSAVAYAAAHDVLVVAAAGNDSGNRDTDPMYPASLSDWNVITVGASTAADAMSTFSAYGAGSVDLFAPGTRVVVTTNTGGYAQANGTSFSSPMVAAAVALYRAAMPSATAAQIKDALLADVDPLPAFTGKSVTGGRLSLGRLTGTAVETVRYAFTGMTAPAGVVSPAIGVSGPAVTGNYDVVLGLGMEHGGEIWALSGKAVTLDGVTVSTDDAGDALFPLGNRTGLDGTGLSPTMELGDGRYVLTVQAYCDGSPVGRTYAAPLLVGSAVPVPASPDGSTPESSNPEPSPDGSTPDGTSPDGSTSPDTGTGPTLPGGGGAPHDPVASDPGSTPDGSDASPGTEPGSEPEGATPGTSPGSGSDGTAPDDGTSVTSPGTTSPEGSAGDTSPGTEEGSATPDDSSGGTTPEGPVPGTTTYPEVGAFRVTSLSPDVVDVEGGTLVTITGEALPADPTVRVGATATGTVVTATATRLTFRVPARVAGVYDVSIYAPDGRSTVLSNALTYVEEVGSTAPGTDGGSSAPEDGTAPEGTPPGTTDPDGSTAPDGTTPGGETSPDDGSSDGPAPASGPVVTSGPAGERLVRSAKFDGLRSIWSLDCSSSCTGVAI